LEAADLVDALKGKGPFTVFAPTDEAFAKLPKGTLESLLKPENKGGTIRVDFDGDSTADATLVVSAAALTPSHRRRWRRGHIRRRPRSCRRSATRSLPPSS
jgi:hypothetical protein